MRIKNITLLSATVFIFSLAFAQKNNGAITGYVKDSSSKTPLVEAVITVSSPGLNGKKFAITDSSGLYKVNDLPAGIYTVSFEMEGFRTYCQENVKLPEGSAIGVSLEMAKDNTPIDIKPKKRRSFVLAN